MEASAPVSVQFTEPVAPGAGCVVTLQPVSPAPSVPHAADTNVVKVSNKTVVYGVLNCQGIRETRVALQGATVSNWLASEGR